VPAKPTAQRPYLLRAMHEWMSDNGLTPQLIVDAVHPGVEVPERFVEDGKIILNISHSATRALQLGNEEVSFEARFGGVSRIVRVPLPAVLGIYARESSQGLVFAADEYGADGQGTTPPPGDEPPPQRPTLRVIK